MRLRFWVKSIEDKLRDLPVGDIIITDRPIQVKLLKPQLDNIFDEISKCYLCETCQEPFENGTSNLVLYNDTLYHQKCFDKICEDYSK